MKNIKHWTMCAYSPRSPQPSHQIKNLRIGQEKYSKLLIKFGEQEVPQ